MVGPVLLAADGNRLLPREFALLTEQRNPFGATIVGWDRKKIDIYARLASVIIEALMG